MRGFPYVAREHSGLVSLDWGEMSEDAEEMRKDSDEMGEDAGGASEHLDAASEMLSSVRLVATTLCGRFDTNFQDSDSARRGWVSARDVTRRIVLSS